MERESPSFLGPCLKEAERSQVKIRQLGGECRFVHDGNGGVDFQKVFASSLLGILSSGRLPKIQPELLTFRESALLESFKKEGKIPRILVVIDFDGVLASPSYTAYKVVENFIDGEVGLADLPGLVKQKGRVGYSNFRGLAEIFQLSESTIIWTSRVNLSDNFLEKAGPLRLFFNYFRDGICYFPFFDQDSQIRLSKFGKGKLSVETNKPIFSAEEKLFGIIERSNPEIVYYIGSNRKDRKTMVAFLKKYPQVVGKLVFLDTCHRYF